MLTTTRLCDRFGPLLCSVRPACPLTSGPVGRAGEARAARCLAGLGPAAPRLSLECLPAGERVSSDNSRTRDNVTRALRPIHCCMGRGFLFETSAARPRQAGVPLGPPTICGPEPAFKGPPCLRYPTRRKGGTSAHPAPEQRCVCSPATGRVGLMGA